MLALKILDFIDKNIIEKSLLSMKVSFCDLCGHTSFNNKMVISTLLAFKHYFDNILRRKSDLQQPLRSYFLI